LYLQRQDEFLDLHLIHAKSSPKACEYLENLLQLCNFGFNVKTRLMLDASLQNSSISQICKKCSLKLNAIIFNAISSHHQFLLQLPVIWNMKSFLDVTADLSSHKLLSPVTVEKCTSRKR